MINKEDIQITQKFIEDIENGRHDIEYIATYQLQSRCIIDKHTIELADRDKEQFEKDIEQRLMQSIHDMLYKDICTLIGDILHHTDYAISTISPEMYHTKIELRQKNKELRNTVNYISNCV